MIVGTAGHIDHGKTTLVRALTGVDTDRLPEEKRRGISIELGYAFLDDGAGGRIGFIDVPGHERLVHTMLAGATGIDAALLLVAADDGPMPQTREHLAVLSLLGLPRGAVVVTKADRAEPERRRAVAAEVAALVADTPLAGAPVFEVAATTGQGLEPLRTWLREQARAEGSRRGGDDGRAFRLAVDRAFTLDGVGTVVTGTVHAGCVRAGDDLRLVPGDTLVRVKSLHAQNRPQHRAEAGQRCALALAGVPREAIARGQWLVAPAAVLASTRLDAELTLWPAETAPLRSGTRVHVHLGSADVLGAVAVLDAGDALPPGGTARVQLVLQQPMGAWHGDRVVLRDASATRTLAGGHVLDPFAPARYRRTAERMAELDALAADTPAARARGLLAVSPQGLDLSRFSVAQGLADPLPPPPGALHTATGFALGEPARAVSEALVLGALDRFHQQHPDEPGPDAARLRRLALPRLADPLFRALLQALQAAGQVQQRGACVHRPEHGVRLSATEERISQKVAPRLAACGFEGAWARDLARDCAESEPLMRTTLARLAQRGELHQVVRDLFYDAPTMRRLAALAREVAARQGGEVTAADFRDATRLGRKRAIQILEHFDRVGLLRRVGDVHRLRADCTLFAEGVVGEGPECAVKGQ
ncbi:MAG: selenocysteine-specific translation elongation factor [Betaproteobacteria bacterium]